MSDDIRISEWSLLASAGMTERLRFTSPDALTSLSVYVGGDVSDVDDLTGATGYAATLSGGDLVATVDLVVPAITRTTPLRLVVNGAVQTVGTLSARRSGAQNPSNTITLSPGTFDFDLTILGVVEAGGGGGSGVVVSVVEGDGISVDATDPENPVVTAEVTQVELDGEASARVSGDAASVSTAAADASSKANAAQAAAIAAAATDATAKVAAEATLARNADNLTSGTVADARIASTIARDSEVSSLIAAEASARDTAIATAIANLIASAPGVLDTLDEIAAALGDDPNFAATMTTLLAGKQPLDTELTALAGLVSAADRLPYFTGSGAASLATFTTFARSILDDADASSVLSTLGVSTFVKTLLDDSDAGTARATLGLGTAATTAATDYATAAQGATADAAVPKSLYDANSILAATTDDTPAALSMGASTILARLASGGIVAATPAQLRTLLSLVVGTDVQAYSANLAAVAGLTLIADRLPYANGSGTLALQTFTSAGRSMVGAADAAAQAALLGAEVFKQAQAVNAQTGTTYTLVAADAGKLVTLSNASAITLTLPQDSDATIAVGTYVDLYALGAGQVTVAAGTGATLRTSGLTAKSRAQYARFGVQKVSANTWNLFGDLAAS